MAGDQPPTARARVATTAARGVVAEGLSQQPRRDVIRNTMFASALLLTLAIALAGLALLIGDALIDGASRLNLDLITNGTSAFPETAGLRSALIGTLWIIGLVIVIIVPIGVGAEIFLEEYASRESRLAQIVQLNHPRKGQGVLNHVGYDPAVGFGGPDGVEPEIMDTSFNTKN